MNKRVGLILVSLSCVLIILCSCGNTRQLQYLQGQFDTLKLSQAKYPEPLIQKNDLVSITVLSDDPKASAYFNMPAQPTAASTAGQVAEGQSNSSASSVYLVDEYGNIQMPSLGKLHIAGLTKAQLDTLVISKVRDRLLNPYAIIRLLSFRITLLGEVGRPGQFTIPTERISLLEAIALAGDLTVYGKRENITVIREINGERSWARLDLKDPNILNSPYFYLQPNDVVIVDLNRNKAAANDQVVLRNITLAMSTISLAAIVISLFQN
jgi:polysaccharide export outer membrane protein